MGGECGTMAMPKMTEIGAAMDELASAVSLYAENMKQLENRISAVINKGKPIACSPSGNPEKPCLCSLAEAIHANAVRIKMLNNSMCDMVAQIEL